MAAQKIISNMALAVQGQVQVVPDDGRGVYVGRSSEACGVARAEGSYEVSWIQHGTTHQIDPTKLSGKDRKIMDDITHFTDILR